ncbi:MAG: hypothetical protein LBD23_15000 [Oscillospiraceae bacterium]|jgi:hypothetical protein|nr:hypothetical protein [Oscillospiraceae bacterium]
METTKPLVTQRYSTTREFPVKKDWNEDLSLMVEDIRRLKAKERSIGDISR